jgi:acetyl esterase/lipase
MTDIRIEENIVVHDVGGRELKVDIFRPANTPGPVQGLLLLPGGGWQTANRAPLTEWARRPTMAKLFGENPAAEIVKAASPIAHVNGAYPPTLLVHGTADTRVPHAMTMRIYQALEQAGVPVDLCLYAGQDHFFDQEAQFCDAIADAMAFFMARYVPVQQPVTTA